MTNQRITPPVILSYGGSLDPELIWKKNGQLIAACFELGYLHDDDRVWDGTYGLGKFWTDRRPTQLVATDLDPAKSPDWPGGLDATDTSFDDETFDVVVLDPDYKLSGTDQGGGDRYGIAGAYRPVNSIMARFQGQLVEGHRVLRSRARHGHGRLLFKCQDQTNAAAKVWVGDDVTNWARALGMAKIGELLFPSYRPQPERSTCLLCDRALMRAKDGRWQDLRRSPAVDVFECDKAGVVESSCEKGIVIGGHQPDPTDNGQDTPHVNFSKLLIFEKAPGGNETARQRELFG